LRADKVGMLPEKLDQIFPYICFVYGVLMTFTLSSPLLVRLAEERMPQNLVAQWRGHAAIAFVCLIVGSLWILETLWL
jgi:hypothetical protein